MRQSDDESVRRMFEWPVPYWRDDKWPCCILDFYRKPRSAWPIAPLGPGIGELSYMNIFMSQIAGRAWTSSRNIVAVLEAAAKHVEGPLKSGDETIILKLPQILKDINSTVSFLKQPDLNPDIYNVMDRLTQAFERRVGLNELLYGLNPGGVQSRTATDIEAKREYVNVRPEYMAGKVEAWMGEAADMEKYCARWFVEADDVRELVGEVGGYFWTSHITDEDPELVVREMRATVEAGSARKPNKQRDAQNVNTVLHVLFPEFSKHADATTDTSALNALVQKWGEAIDMDVSDMMLGPRQPAPPSEEAMAAQHEMQQAEMAKQQAEVEKKQLEVEGKRMDIEGKQIDLVASEADAERHELEIDMHQEKHELELDQDQERHEQELEQSWDEHDQKLEQQSDEHRQKLEQARQLARQQAQANAQRQAQQQKTSKGGSK